MSPPTSTFPAAELDRRFYAFAVDRFIAWSLYAVGAVAAYRFLGDSSIWTVVLVVLGVVLVVGLALALLQGLLGTSPGKAALGLRVVHETSGAPIGVPAALLRALVLGVAALPTFGLGVATLAWTAVMDRGRQRRGWHDHLAGSVVVDVRPVPGEAEEVEARPRHVVNLTAMRLVPAPQAPPALPVPVLAGATRPPVSPPSVPPPPPAPPPAPTPVPVTETTAERTVVRAQPAGAPRWRVAFDSGDSFVVEGLVLVGRRPEPRPGEPVQRLVPLSSTDMSVSKTHAQLQVAADGILVVMDRGSTNGTTLLRQGVPRELGAGQPRSLLDGDIVGFGDRQMTVARET